MQELFVPANGVTLHVVDCGGDGPPVLFVHGTGLVAQVWEPVARELHPRHRPLLLDRRGSGESDKPPEGYQLTDTAADIAGVIDALGIAGCAAVGHSSGGAALLVCGADHPGLIGRLALVDPIIFPRRTGASPLMPRGGMNGMVETTRRRRTSWPSAREMFDSLGSRFPFDGWREDALRAFVNHGARRLPDGSVELKTPPELEAKMYQHDGTVDLFEKLAAFTSPLLIVRAARTDRFPREVAERAQATAPDCTLIEMPNVTHFAPMEQPDRVAALIREFLT